MLTNEHYRATGKICSRTLRDKQGCLIISEGEVVTHSTLQMADAAGMVEDILACAGLTTISPPDHLHESHRGGSGISHPRWQPSLPPAAKEVIEEEEEDAISQ